MVPTPEADNLDHQQGTLAKLVVVVVLVEVATIAVGLHALLCLHHLIVLHDPRVLHEEREDVSL